MPAWVRAQAGIAASLGSSQWHRGTVPPSVGNSGAWFEQRTACVRDCKPIVGTAILEPEMRRAWLPVPTRHRRRSLALPSRIWSMRIMIVNAKAVLMPNSSMPSAASSAPSICHSPLRTSPEAPRVVIESTE